jgi:hypothetical protein
MLFTRVDRIVRVLMIAFGLVLGFVVVRGQFQTPISFLDTAILVAVSLVIGAVFTGLIWAGYRLFFPDGIPLPDRPGTIGPKGYGKVAGRRFADFALGLGVIVACGALDQMIRSL